MQLARCYRSILAQAGRTGKGGGPFIPQLKPGAFWRSFCNSQQARGHALALQWRRLARWPGLALQRQDFELHVSNLDVGAGLLDIADGVVEHLFGV